MQYAREEESLQVQVDPGMREGQVPLPPPPPSPLIVQLFNHLSAGELAPD